MPVWMEGQLENRQERGNPEMDISASSSYEFYLTPEKALEDIYDKYARRTSEEANYDYLIETKIEERIQAFRMAGNSEKDQLKFTVEAMDDEA